MNVTSNLPEEPNYSESKFYVVYDNTVEFIKNLVYLVKKVFML